MKIISRLTKKPFQILRYRNGNSLLHVCTLQLHYGRCETPNEMKNVKITRTKIETQFPRSNHWWMYRPKMDDKIWYFSSAESPSLKTWPRACASATSLLLSIELHNLRKSFWKLMKKWNARPCCLLASPLVPPANPLNFYLTLEKYGKKQKKNKCPKNVNKSLRNLKKPELADDDKFKLSSCLFF